MLTILDETVDMDLWQAQRVLQAASTAAVDLSGCDALSRALDVAAGEAGQLSGAEPLLSTVSTRNTCTTSRPPAVRRAAGPRPPTGCAPPTTRWPGAPPPSRRSTTRCAGTRRSRMDLGRLADERADASKRLTAARVAAEAVAALTQQLKEAEVVAAAADATHAASSRRSPNAGGCAPTSTNGLRLSQIWKPPWPAALEEQATAGEVQEAAQAAAEDARAAVETSQTRVDAARHAVEQLSERDEGGPAHSPAYQDRCGPARARAH